VHPKGYNDVQPVYRFVTATGEDLVRLDNRVEFDPKKRFVPFKMNPEQEGATFTRLESSMEIF